MTSPRRDNAAARLYIEYRERIYRFCLSRLRSREEAEDAVQNVFMRVHMALDRGVVPQFEAAWLYKIAHNVCLSRIDSNARRGAEELHAFDEDDVQIAAPEVGREELAGLNEALEAMPHNLRTAILLREWQGLSYAEIADAMGLSVSAVETLIFRARRHLAYALEHGPDAKRNPVARLLNLPAFGWLRNLFFGAGPAKLAAGAALVALGGGGAAVALTATMPTSGPTGRQTPAAVRIAQVAAAAATARSSGRAPAIRAGAPSVRASTTRNVVAIRGTSHPVPVVVVTTTAGAGGGSGSAPAGSPGTPTAAPGTPRSTTSGHAPPPPGTAPTATTTVSVSVPGSTVPTVTVPTTVSAPTVSVPAVPGPPANPPTVSVPTVTVPTVTVPTVSVPTASVPSVTVPTVSVPTVSTPTTITVPTVSLPVVGVVAR
jgi:RNA polymerase sigma factor (sigma-70 family)